MILGMKKTLFACMGGLFFVAGIALVYVTLPRPLSRNSIVQHFLPAYRSLAKLADMPYLGYFFFDTQLPEYTLMIATDDISRLHNALPQDPFEGRLLENFKDTKVPAFFIADGYMDKVDVRYRGINPIHWTTKKKSLRVNFPDDQLFQNHEVLNFIVPEDRHWIGSMVARYRAQKLDVEMPEISFVNLAINNEPMGVYVEVEGWTSHFFERRDLPSVGAHLYGTKDVDRQDSLYVQDWEEQLSDDTRPFVKLQEFFDAYALSNGAFQENMRDILDMESYSRVVALNVLFANVAEPQNMRLYYNPEHKRFSVIPSDEVSIFCQEGQLTSLAQAGFLRRLTELSDVRNRVADIVRSYVADEKNLEDDLRYFDAVWDSIKGDIFRDTAKAIPNYRVEQEISSMRLCLIDSFRKASAILP